MINLRYHIVSITAVFLALGIGLVFGASFIDRATVNQLDQNLDAIEEQNDDLEAENARVEDRIAAADAEEEALRTLGLPQLVAGRLEGVGVVVLTVEGVDGDTVSSVSEVLEAAGAELGGVLRLTERLLLDEPAEVTDLADVLELNTDEPDRLRASLARRLGSVLADAASIPAPLDPVAPADPTVDPTAATTTTVVGAPVEEPELLAALRATGFVELDAPAEPPVEFTVVPEAGLRIVAVSGAGAVLAPGAVLEPMLEQVVEGTVALVGGPVVVAAQHGPDPDVQATEDFDPEAERVAFVGPLRQSDTVRERLSTVDDLERFAGLLATVLALEHGAAGQFGHYGVGEGAQSLLPPEPAADTG